MPDPVLTPPQDEATRILAPPSQGYVDGNDNLRITSFNSQTGVIVTVSGRFYDLDHRRIQTFSRTHTPNTDRTVKQTIEKLGRGYLLNLIARATSGAPLYGETYVLLELVRGETGTADVLGVLGADFVTLRHGVAFPGSPIVSPLEGPGYCRSVVGSTPGVGAEIVETVPSGARWQLLTLATTLVASATVATRTTTVIIDDGTNNLIQTVGINQATANQTAINYFGNRGVQIALLSGQNVTAPIGADVLLSAGARIRTSTGSLQVGDQYASPKYLVREWLEAA